MAEKRASPEAPGSGRRKRAAPTIDLKATEVPADPAPKTAPEPQPEAAAAPQPEAPTAEPPKAAAPPPSESSPREEAHSEFSRYATPLAAGIAGAVSVAALLAALWSTGIISAPSEDTSGLRAEVAALQGQVRDLQSRPVPAADNKAVDTLRERVKQIEDSIAKLPPGDRNVAERLAAAENAMKSLGVALTALSRRADDSAANAAQANARADAAEKAVKELHDSVQRAGQQASSAVAPAALEAVQQRVAALEQALKSMRDEIAKSVAADNATRLALSAAALRSAAESGAPFAAELAQAKSLGADANTLAPLDRFAQSGVPSKAALAGELRALLPAMAKLAGGEAPTGGFFERLQANASKLVRIQPVDAPRGDAPVDVLARIEVEAARADIDGTLADLAKLPEAVRAPAQTWIARAQARQAALAAAAQFAASAAKALARP